MVDRVISDWPAVSTPDLADLLFTEQNADSVARKLTITQIFSLLAASDVGLGNVSNVLQAVLGANVFTGTQSWAKGADIASAATLILGTDGNYFDVTGTTTITGITVPAGTLFMLQFDGALTFTDGASLDLEGNANITTAAGDHALCFATAANTVRVLKFFDASIEAKAFAAEHNAAGTHKAINTPGVTVTGSAASPPTAKTLSEDMITKISAKISYSGGTPSLDSNVGISGIADTATGKVTFTFGTAMADANYALSGSDMGSARNSVRAESPATGSVIGVVGSDSSEADSDFSIMIVGKN